MQLYAVTDRMWLKKGETLPEVVEQVLKNGATFLQLREKDLEEVAFEAEAEQLKELQGEAVTTYVPFRNGLFLATAASIALEYGCDVIYYGPHADDAAGNAYPDCSHEFNEAMNQAVYLGSGQKVRLIAPFVDRTKKDIVAEGLRLGVPYELTWSCYDGGEKPCHECGTCRDREAAFAANGVVDPLVKD